MMDSVTWESIGTGRCGISPTPFLDSLKSEGLWTTNLYSHGPYTDAATRSLYTGRNTLDDFGYFFKLNSSPISHYKAFKEQGYQTIGYYYPYYMMGSNVTKFIDKLYYKTGFEFGSEWGGIFSYYYEIAKERKLTSTEYVMLSRRLELLFDVWLKFYEDIETKPNAALNLIDILKFSDVEKGKSILIQEFDSFQANPFCYIDNFLKMGLSHVFWRINDISIDNRISRDYLNKTYKRHKRFFRRIMMNNFVANATKTLPSPKRIFYSFQRYIKTKDRSELAFLENFFLGLTPLQVVKSRWGKPRWQNMPSTRFQMTFIEDQILPSLSKDKPFFLCFNIEEAHNNLSFFTYDIQDDKVVDEEISVLNDFVKKLGINFKGNLIYYLGLRYMDWCIEKFCNKLKALGLWDHTSILFTADHGSSYTFYPIHNARVNNFYDECYHIPILIRHPGLKPTEIKTYQYSKDILPTFMDVLGLKISPYFKGISMLRNTKEREYVLHEYMGPGCPDILQRPIWFSIRDKNYAIGYKVSIHGTFKDGHVCEVYNLRNDPKCYYNIVDKVNLSDISYLLDHIYNRFMQLKKGVPEYYDMLKNNEKIPMNL